MSCTHSAYILQEAVQHAKENGSKVHLAFLDVQKAFDTVWHNGLFHKLFHFGIRGCTWRLLKQWYSSSSCCVLWKGQLSCSITLSQGVKQGAILSPLLYSIFVDDLLVALENSGLGIHIGDLYCGAPMYADDLALAASAPEELQAMLNMVAHYAHTWRYRLNPSKSCIMVVGRRKPPNFVFHLDGIPLETSQEYTHLGIIRTASESSISRTQHQISLGRSTFFALNRVGARFGCLHPRISAHLYSCLVLPRMLYGAELWSLTKTEMEMIERMHCKILRTIQGLPTRCPREGVRVLLDCSSIADMVATRKLCFVISIASLPPPTLWSGRCLWLDYAPPSPLPLNHGPLSLTAYLMLYASRLLKNLW